MSMPAISSIELSRCTMAFSLLSSREPTARLVVTTSGMATGSTATRMTMHSLRADSHSWLSRKSSVKKIGRTKSRPTPHMILATTPKSFSTFPWRLTLASRAIVFPKKVSAPIRVTCMSSSPCMTTAPESTSSPGYLVTASDSPVRLDSSISMGSPAPMISPSAGMITPAASSTTSPGTSSLTGTSTQSPSRLARQWGADISFKAFTASAALRSPK
mmetsp:Transcript_30963/g.86753  ORF Transcript_30963/g.86753 Transcript_30963/m.86753 type:complete len:216 (-) Transcript_30963:350-997(-)